MTETETDDIIKQANALGPAPSIDAFLSALIERQDIALIANHPNVREGGETFVLEDYGRIVGPVVQRDGGPTNQQIANRALKALYSTLALDGIVDEGQYFRWTKSRHEIKAARGGRLRNSRNHRRGSGEDGVSVCEGPWVYCLARKYCYLVSGEVVGEGSDGEPLLSNQSIQVCSPLLDRAWVIREFYARNRDALDGIVREKEFPGGELVGFLLGCYHFA